MSSATVPPETSPPKALALRWTEALNARDVKALGEMHADEVRFYGSRISNADYVKRIKAALDADPTFHQTITFTNVEWRNPTNVKVSFRKKDAKHETLGYLLVQSSTGKKWSIIEESDVQSDAIPPTCFDYGIPVTLTGTVQHSAYLVNDQEWKSVLLRLERPICVRAGKGEMDLRVDSIEDIQLREGPDVSDGKKTVVGTLHHEDGPYYATAVAMSVDSAR